MSNITHIKEGLPEWIEEHTCGIFAPGYEARICHPYKDNGEPCSAHKTGASKEACGLYRKSTGWYVHCFRCGFSSFFSDGWGDPVSVKKKLERIKSEPAYESLPVVSLPEDMIPMQSVDSPIPYEAWQWLWDAGLEDSDIRRYEIGYSHAYDRVIIPCRAYGILSPSGSFVHKLMGWIGREVKYKTKQERELHHTVKYLTKKSDEIKHLLFFAPSTSKRVILVEDALSAIKIQRATGFASIALLTTYVPNHIMHALQGYQVTMWLDGDMMAKSIKYATEFNKLGIKASYCCTPEDPKDYSDMDILDFLDKENK